MGAYTGDVGAYRGELGTYAGDVGAYSGDVGAYRGEVGSCLGERGEDVDEMTDSYWGGGEEGLGEGAPCRGETAALLGEGPLEALSLGGAVGAQTVAEVTSTAGDRYRGVGGGKGTGGVFGSCCLTRKQWRSIHSQKGRASGT